MKVGVIAGNRQEYKEFASRQLDIKNDGTIYFYVSDVEMLRGYTGQVIKIGTYYNREDIEELELAFERCSTRQAIESIILEEEIDYTIMPPKSASDAFDNLTLDDLPF